MPIEAGEVEIEEGLGATRIRTTSLRRRADRTAQVIKVHRECDVASDQ